MKSSITAQGGAGESPPGLPFRGGPHINLQRNVAKGPASKPCPNRNGAMRRLTNRLSILLALALLALGAAARFALVHTPVPPLVFIVGGAILGLLLVLAKLPLVARRPIVFLITLALLADLSAGPDNVHVAIK